jgi:glycosyltransferase involved in cell wall biosynthesis
MTVRVLHLVTTGQRRGAEIFASDLIKALGEDVAQRVAVLQDVRNDVPYAAPTEVLKAGRWSVPGIRINWGTLSSINELVHEWQPNVIQAHGGDALKYAHASRACRHSSVVYRRIGTTFPWLAARRRRIAHGRLMRKASRVIALAETLRSEIVDTFGVPGERVVTIPNGVNVDRFVPQRDRETVRRELRIPADAPVILSVGALTWEKDPIGHLHIARKALEATPEARYLIAGDGPLRRDMQRAVADLELEGRVGLLGMRTDVPDLLHASDVFLLASITEGMPACVIEAGLAGLPVAAFGIAGIPEVIEDGVTGFLASPGDHGQLADLLEQLLKDPQRVSMGQAAREQCRRKFDIATIAPRYRALYDELAG